MRFLPKNFNRSSRSELLIELSKRATASTNKVPSLLRGDGHTFGELPWAISSPLLTLFPDVGPSVRVVVVVVVVVLLNTTFSVPIVS